MTNLGTGSSPNGRSGVGVIFADSCGREKERDRQVMPPPLRLLTEGFMESNDLRGMYGPSASMDRPREPSMKMRRAGERGSRPLPYGRDLLDAEEEEERCWRGRGAGQSWGTGCHFTMPPQRPQQQMPFWMAP
uniref:KH homology domain-containing protein 4-like n=1 Tax=Pristiophorus japonicus TaxID=55135 RepID=UPI00398F047F